MNKTYWAIESKKRLTKIKMILYQVCLNYTIPNRILLVIGRFRIASWKLEKMKEFTKEVIWSIWVSRNANNKSWINLCLVSTVMFSLKGLIQIWNLNWARKVKNSRSCNKLIVKRKLNRNSERLKYDCLIYNHLEAIWNLLY